MLVETTHLTQVEYYILVITRIMLQLLSFFKKNFTIILVFEAHHNYKIPTGTPLLGALNTLGVNFWFSTEIAGICWLSSGVRTLEPDVRRNQKVPLDVHVPRAPACRRSFCRTHRPGRSQPRERELQTRQKQWNTQARRPAQHDEMTSSSATTFQLQYFWYCNGGCSKYLQKTAGRRLLHCALAAAQCIVIGPVCGFVYVCVCGSVTMITRVSEWVSSFLTAHTPQKGYLVPYMVWTID